MCENRHCNLQLQYTNLEIDVVSLKAKYRMIGRQIAEGRERQFGYLRQIMQISGGARPMARPKIKPARR